MADLDQGAIQKKFDEIATYLEDQYPDVDVRHGVFGNVVVGAAAIAAASNESTIQSALRSIFLQDLSQQSSDINSAIVDKIAGNFGLKRREALKAKGNLWIEISQLSSQTLSSGILFSNGSTSFQTTNTYYIVTSADAVTSPYHIFPVALTGGHYGFVLPVEATEAKNCGTIGPGASFTLVSTGAIQNYVSATAFDTFFPGRNKESDSDLISRLAVGVTPRVPYLKYGVLAILNDSRPDISIVDLNIIGIGSPLAKRMKHWLFPISMGQQLDIYIKTSKELAYVTKEVTAVLYNKASKIWRFSVTSDLVPGYYRITKISLRNDPSSNFAGSISETRGFDTSLDYVPDIVDAVEAAYSRYQTAVVDFTDTITDVTNLTEGVSRQNYYVTFLAMPWLKEIHDILTDNQNRTNNSDILVKGVIPCITSVTLQMTNRGGSSFNSSQLKSAIADAINSLPIGMDLTSDVIQAAVQLYAPGWSITSLNMSGTIYKPNGTNQTISSGTILAIPEDSSLCLGRDSASYFCSPDSVTVSTA